MTEKSFSLEEAKELEVQGRYQEAEDALSALIEKSRRFQDSGLAALLNNRGIVRRMLRRYDDSFADYKAALATDPDDGQKALAYTNMADIQRVARSDFGAAHSSLDEALTYTENGSLMHAKAVDQRGLVFVAQKEYDSAIKPYKRAREICEALMRSNPGDKDIENRFGQVVHHLGVAYSSSKRPFLSPEDNDKLDEAYESQITALDTFTKIGDQQGIVNSVVTLGRIALIRNEYDDAIEQYKKAWDILEQTKYERGITALALHFAEAYLAKEEPENAAPYLERFRKGILQKELTEHDMKVMDNQVKNIREMHNKLGLKFDLFEV